MLLSHLLLIIAYILLLISQLVERQVLLGLQVRQVLLGLQVLQELQEHLVLQDPQVLLV
jgi:hypothetical protein